jgi:hypothetical protein
MVKDLEKGGFGRQVSSINFKFSTDDVHMDLPRDIVQYGFNSSSHRDLRGQRSP